MAHWPTTAQASPGPALECFDCSAITPDNHAEPGQDCPECGGGVTDVVTITACDAPDPSECKSDDHLWALCVHVTRED